MASSGMLRHVALVRVDVSEEPSASIIRVTRIGELGTLALTSNLFLCSMHRLLVTGKVVPSSPIPVTAMMEMLSSSEASVLKEPHDVTSQKTSFFKIMCDRDTINTFFN
jgi:hypothetical protein